MYIIKGAENGAAVWDWKNRKKVRKTEENNDSDYLYNAVFLGVDGTVSFLLDDFDFCKKLQFL